MNLSRQLLLLLLFCFALLPACDGRRGASPSRATPSAEATTADDNFAIAARYWERFEHYEPAYGQRNLLYHLNQWLAGQDVAGEWTPDPLVATVPIALQSTPLAQQYDRMSFDSLDGWSLWEAAMLHRVSTWALRRAHDDPRLTDWYLAMEGTHGVDHVDQLRQAARLFDWTVRNIQLDPLWIEPATAGEESAANAAGRQAGDDTEPGQPGPGDGYLRGRPGPGYRFEPWQVLLYGRGDAWQRARVFIRLARQQELPVVMLAVGTAGEPQSVRPWLPALLLDEQLYLFDTRLGVPLPGAHATGIATLADVIADPQLLRQCDVPDHAYPIGAGQLSGVEALIDATPGELSRRMQVVEREFVGEQKLRLAVNASAIAKPLRQIPGVGNVRIWPLAMQTILYRQSLPPLPARSRAEQLDYLLRQAIFDDPNPLARGRWQHLAGNFASDHENDGATRLYMASRHSESMIAVMAQSPEVQRQFGITAETESDPQRRAMLVQIMEQRLRISAQNASFWLGLINYEEGKFKVALDWLERQTLGAQAQTVWEPSASYNAGRSHEHLQEFEEALAIYRTQQDSPSRVGQLVRAKLIEEQFSQ